MWTLVKLKKGDKEWLLIKERDAYASSSGPLPPEESVLSGLTVEDLKAGRAPAAGIREELVRLGAPKRAVQPEGAKLMLAESRDRAFSAPGWLFELKLDGYRLLAARENAAARLLSRNGNDLVGFISRGHSGRRGASIEPITARRRSRRPGRCRAPQLSAAAAAGEAHPGTRHPPGDRGEPGHLLCLRSAGGRGLRSCGPCRCPSERSCCESSCRPRDSSVSSSTSKPMASCSTSRFARWAWRASLPSGPIPRTAPADQRRGSRSGPAGRTTSSWSGSPRPRAPGPVSVPCIWANT